MEKCLCSLESELSIDNHRGNTGFNGYGNSYVPPAIAMAQYAEYHFLDSSIFIVCCSTDLIAVCSLSALIAKQCKVHQTKC